MQSHATPLSTPRSARAPHLSRREHGKNQRTANDAAPGPDGPKKSDSALGTDSFERDGSARAHAAQCRNLIGATGPGHAPMRAQAGAPERDLAATVPEDLMGQVLAGLAGASSMAARRKKAG